MRGRDPARSLLTLAEHDSRALEGMSDAEIFAEEIFGFHAQQAVEKALKAWISAIGEDYPLTHDLGALLSIVEDSGHEIAAFSDVLSLNVYAVQFRYSIFDAPETLLNRAATRAMVKSLVTHVAKLLEKPDT